MRSLTAFIPGLVTPARQKESKRGISSTDLADATNSDAAISKSTSINRKKQKESHYSIRNSITYRWITSITTPKPASPKKKRGPKGGFDKTKIGSPSNFQVVPNMSLYHK
jgi:hypothetical protein